MMRRPRVTRPQIVAVAALDDDLRRGMYEFIRRAHRPVTRQEAAEAVGISRKLAAFHLDKLVSAGLLRTHPAPQGGLRRVGRRPTAYQPTDTDIHIAIPDRRPDTLATVLIDAVDAEHEGEDARSAALRVAREHGRAAGQVAARPPTDPGPPEAGDPLVPAQRALEEHGFEPERDATTRVRLRNCPFHPYAGQAPELVCGINHAFLCGMLEGLRADEVEARLIAPKPGECCVELRSTTPPATGE
jgi:predicted ArsR family transcriptional regulator